MSTKRKNRVIVGNSHITVYPWIHPSTGSKRWRFRFTKDGQCKYRTFLTKIAAEHAAEQTLKESSQGLAWLALDIDTRRFLEEVHRRTAATDRGAVLAFLKSRDSSTLIESATEAFMSHKISEAGETTPHLKTVSLTLEKLSKHFTGRRVSEIHLTELAAWWNERSAGRASKTKREIRAQLVTFWKWSLRQGLAGSDPITVAERLPSVKVATGEKRVLSHDDLCRILNAVDQEFRAWVILGAFAGLRPEEIAPSAIKKASKRGLRCEEIDWRFKVIRLPAEVSKTDRPRIIPMSEALMVGLQWAGIEDGMTGPTTLKNPSQTKQIAKLGRDLFDGNWPKDALRHSYGSYRNAILRHLDQVAEEMGNSVAMLHRHYHNPQTQEDGERWFELRPISAPNCSAIDPQENTFWSVPSETENKKTLIL